jgi:glycosyltransferase involved in cell wall biosynthesis
MALQGHQVELLTSGPGEGSHQVNGYIKHLSDKLTAWKPRRADLACLLLTDLQLLRKAAQLLAAGHQWDVLHAHEWNAVQTGRLLRDACQLPLVGTLHLSMNGLTEWTDEPLYQGHPLAGRLTEADLYQRQMEGHLCVTDTARLITVSHAYGELVRNMYGRTPDVVHNGINRDEWNPSNGSGPRARRDHQLPDRPLALFTGRIATMKGVEYILRAVRSRDLGYCVVLAGEVNATTEEQREQWTVTRQLRQLQAAHPERLRWLGFRKSQELRDLHLAADVALMPSTTEPFGIAALEAMAMGTPLISTEVDGLGEIVKDGRREYAMIVPPHSSEDIAQALELLRSPVRRHELRALGLERAGHFTWADAAAKTVAVYSHAVEGRERKLCLAT